MYGIKNAISGKKFEACLIAGAYLTITKKYIQDLINEARRISKKYTFSEIMMMITLIFLIMAKL
ncbi:MAG: hypothetical protein IMZ59_00865 [Actinobacteria bacterium]|nr:hypothetical protein [Actinomycetota bacterium]